MKNKYLPVAIILIIVLIASTLSVSAMSGTDDITVYIKGNYFMSNPEQGYEVVIKDDRTFLPLRYVAETLNYQVDWDQSTQGISMTSGDIAVNMNVGNSNYTLNGEQRTMDTQPFIQSDRTYVPLRFAAEAFGEEVQWDNNNRTAIIGNYSDHDLNSTPGTPVELKKAGIIINVNDPDSLVIEDVQTGTAIYDKESYGAYKAEGSEGGWILTVYRQSYPDVDMISPGILLDYVDGVYIQAQLPSDVQAYLVEGNEQPYMEKYDTNSDMVKESLKHILLSEEEGKGDVSDQPISSDKPQQGGPGGQGGNRGGGSVDKSADTELQTMIANVAPRFELLTYEDKETGTSLKYQLYVPSDYDQSKSYPLVQFIPDSSVIGKDAGYVLTQGWGGMIWASEGEQAKHPAFVVVPVFTETVVDDNYNHSDQIEVAVRLINSLTEKYSIDKKRIYTTGQSMGGMTSFYLNITYPDLFAASLFVGSQWDTSKLNILENKNFFYIVSAGDPQASAGQSELISVFDKDGAKYSHSEWSAQDDKEIQNKAVESMLEKGNSCNFITFTEGTTLTEGQTAMAGAGEHMTSFDYAYKIEAVRDWLFQQSK